MLFLLHSFIHLFIGVILIEHLLMVQWVVGSIPQGGPIELFSHVCQCSTTGIAKAMVCAILSVGWCIRDPLVLVGKTSPCFSVLFLNTTWICFFFLFFSFLA